MPHLVDFAKTHKYDFVTLSGDQVSWGVREMWLLTGSKAGGSSSELMHMSNADGGDPY